MTHPLIRVAGLALDTKPILYQGVRKIINGLTFEVPSVAPGGFKDFNWYGPNKFKQLVRNYVNEEEFARVRSVLDRRRDQTFTSVALSLRGAKKESRSQGWCMLSLIVTRSKREERIEVQYRSTELTLKFGGDLAFLPWILEHIGADPGSPVTFRFANCFLSGVYLPYLVTLVDDPVSMLERVDDLDEKFFQNGTRFFLRSAYKKDQVFPYSPENVAHRFGWRNIGATDMRRIRDFLESRHKTFGKPLPKTHYKEGEYIPRGQRKKEEEE